MADGGLREDEIDCEEAVAIPPAVLPRIRADRDAPVRVQRRLRGDRAGALDRQSQCILALSCPAIVAQGICARARDLPSPSTSTQVDFVGGGFFGAGGSGAGGGAPTSPVTVCP